MGLTSERLANVAFVGAALVVAAVAVHREFFDAPRPAPNGMTRAPTQLVRWQSLERVGKWVTDSSAPVKVIVFSDYECPFCKRFFDSVRTVVKESPGKIALMIVPMPLSMHKFAAPAEIAAACTEEAHPRDALAFSEAVFAKQDSLGLRSWATYAADAGVTDTVAFNSCIASGRFKNASKPSLAVADSLGFTSTPTVIINGWRYYTPPYAGIGALVERYASDRFRPKTGL